MNRFSDLVTKAARDMARATPGAPGKPSSPATAIVRLDSNENPFGPSPLAIEAMRRAMSESHRYPENDCLALRQRLSELHGVPAAQILVAAGSTGVISLLCHTLLGPGLNAVTSQRSFIVYGMAVRAAGAQFIEAPMRQNGVDLDAILAEINPHTRLVLIANPNNPTGTVAEAEQIETFLAKVPPHVVVVLDEAYHDYATHFAKVRHLVYSRSLSYVLGGASVVAVRTFSKAHGLAGLRVGYGMGPAELLSYCASMQDTYSVSSAAQSAALASLDDQPHIAHAVSSNAEESDSLSLSLRELGFPVASTWANFLYCELGRDAAPVSQQLRQEGICVRPLGAWGAPACMRVSIGTPAQNQTLVDALRRITLL